ncbi:Nucleolar protein [Arachis hypogaea]|nr:Nucleolar protein [Arachis hypogaea]
MGKNKKSNKKSGPDAVAMKLKASSKGANNPFESIWSRRKFDVLGQKRKGTPAASASLAPSPSRRKKTLLKEYEHSTKSSVFEDKRIGEGDEALDEFGKAILRTQV